MEPPTLAEHIGSRVREIRLKRGWTQRDLAAQLEAHGGRWTRAQVGLLETQGVRAERLGDVLTLCSALDVGLETLLNDDRAEVLLNGNALPIMSLLAAMNGPDEDPRLPLVDQIDPTLIGSPDPSAAMGLAQRANLSVEETLEKLKELYGTDASFARDAIAELTADTTRREARALRGRASRRMLEAIRSGQADPEDLRRVRRLMSKTEGDSGCGDHQPVCD